MSIESAGTVATDFVTGTRTVSTLPVTIVAGANRILTVEVHATGDLETVASVTFGGVPLTSVVDNTLGFRPTIRIYQLVAPAVGTDDVVTTMTGAISFGVAAMSYTGVNQTTPTGATAVADAASGTDATVVINTTSDNSMIVGGMTARQAGTAAAPGAGTTERYDEDTGAGVGDILAAGGDEITTTMGAITFNFTFVSNERWAIACIELMPATNGMSGGDFNSAAIDKFDDNLQNYLFGGEAAGNDRVDSVGGVDWEELGGTIANAAGKSGSGIQFVRADDNSLRIASGNVVDDATYLIFSAWYKRDSTGNFMFFLRESGTTGVDRLTFVFNTTDNLQIRMRDVTGGSLLFQTTVGTFTDTTSFHHVFGVWDIPNDRMYIYHDGTEVLNAAQVMGNFASGNASERAEIGNSVDSSTLAFDGIIDEPGIWAWYPGDETPTEAQMIAMKDALFNSGAGRFWAADAVMPTAPTNVSLNRYDDSGSTRRQILNWQNPADADFHHCEVGRAFDDTATDPTDILESDIGGDGSISYVTTSTSTDPAEFAGVNAQQGPPFGPSDDFGVIIDPDQADTSAAFFVRSVDVAGNASAWVKATVITVEGAAPADPTLGILASTGTTITQAVTLPSGTTGLTKLIRTSDGTEEDEVAVTAGVATFTGVTLNRTYHTISWSVLDGIKSEPVSSGWIFPSAANSKHKAILDEVESKIEALGLVLAVEQIHQVWTPGYDDTSKYPKIVISPGDEPDDVPDRTNVEFSNIYPVRVFLLDMAHGRTANMERILLIREQLKALFKEVHSMAAVANVFDTVVVPFSVVTDAEIEVDRVIATGLLLQVFVTEDRG